MTRRWILQLPALAFALDVKKHGARGDGQTNDTAAVQKAIDALAHGGGGVAHFPSGIYKVGTLVLRSNVTLRLSPGATLRASRNLADYRRPHLIYARNAENIAIEGGGMIDGQGDMNWDADFRPHKERLGPLVELVGCHDVRIENVHIRDSPRWTIHPKNCDRVWIRGISIINHRRGPNTDGIDPDSSRNVHISDCYIEAGDDCIVLKTTNILPWLPEGYGEPVRPCENVTVTNCTLVSSASALKLGTESLADIRHCTFSNCVIRDSRTGIALFGKDGGTFEAIQFSNISIQTAPKHGRGPTWPIVIDLEKRRKESRVGAVRDVSFRDIRISTSGRVLVAGMPERPLENVSFRGLDLRLSGFEEWEAADKPRGGAAQPVAPEADYSRVPAALIFANVRDLELCDVRVSWEAAETAREGHALYAARIDGLRIDGFYGRQAPPNGEFAAIVLRETTKVMIAGSRAAPGTNVFLHLERTPRDEVLMAANDLRTVRREIE